MNPPPELRVESFKPQPAPGVKLVRLPEGGGVLKDPARGHYLPISSAEADLFQLLDGRRTAEELFQASYKAGRKVSISGMLNFLSLLARQGFLDNDDYELQQLGLASGEISRPSLKERLATMLTGSGWFANSSSGWLLALTHPLWLVVLAATTGLLAAIPLSRGARFRLPRLESGFGAKFLLFFLALCLILSLRGIMTGAALRALGGEVWRGGIRLFGFLPYFHTDLRDVAVLGRRGRLAAGLAGLLSVVLGIAGGIGIMSLEAEWGPPLGTFLIIAGAFLIFVSLSPFWRSDLSMLLDAMDEEGDWRRRAVAYLRRRMLFRVFSLGDQFSGEPLLILVGVYGLLWLYFTVQQTIAIFDKYWWNWLADLSTAEGWDAFALILTIGGVALLAVVLAAALLLALGAMLLAPIMEPYRQVVTRPRATSSRDLAKDPDAAAALAGVPLFAGLADDERQQLAASVRVEQYPAGKLIIRQGDAGQHFYSLRSGEAEVLVEDHAGMVKRVAVLRAGDGFGEIALLTGGPRTAHVRATTPVEVLALSRDTFRTFAESQGLSAQKVTDILRFSQFLRKVKLFDGMPSDRIFKLCWNLEPLAKKRGEIIVKQGERGDYFYLIREGKVAVSVREPEGDEKQVAELNEGDYFGEIALIKDVPRTATCVAAADVILLALSRERFLATLGGDFRVAVGLENTSESRLRHSGIYRLA